MKKANKMPFYALLSANAVSQTGNVLTIITLPWFVYSTTKSAGQTGLIGFSETLPLIFAVFYTGVVLNKTGYKRGSVIADLGSGLAVLSIPLLSETIGLQFWELLGLVFMRSVFDGPGVTARQSLLPDVIEMAGISPERGNSAYQLIQRLSLLLGSPLAGILIGLLSPTNVLWVDTATFAISALVIGILIPSTYRAKQAEKETGLEIKQAGYLAQLKASWNFVKNDRLLVAILIMVVITNFLDGPLGSVLLPVFVNQNFGNAGILGILIAGFGLGAIIGTVLFGAIGSRLSRRTTYFGAFILFSLPIMVLALVPVLPVSIVTVFAAGVAAGPINPLIMTVLQERLPLEQRGQIFSLVSVKN